jgi:UDP-glucuronate decarboxylase
MNKKKIYNSKKEIEISDFNNILKDFKNHSKIRNKTILISGFNGFLGHYIVNFLLFFSKKLKWKKLILVDNSNIKKIKNYKELKKNKNVIIINKSIVDINFKKTKFSDVNYIMHMASIASPHYYRKFPLKTIEANVDGLKNILNSYKHKNVNLLYFSSSEIYGDPPKNKIPTSEDFNGNVSCIGPRSCYDEAKRFCETICYYYSKIFKINIKIVRPFNNYGPGLNTNDKRLPADLANSILKNKNILIYSDGKPTRSYCYISDAVTAYFLALVYPRFEIFNVGNEKEEISVKKLTLKYVKIAKKYLNYKGNIYLKKSKDPDYLTNNPNRRCPDISKARKKLNFNPIINIDEGIKRYLMFNFLK